MLSICLALNFAKVCVHVKRASDGLLCSLFNSERLLLWKDTRNSPATSPTPSSHPPPPATPFLSFSSSSYSFLSSSPRLLLCPLILFFSPDLLTPPLLTHLHPPPTFHLPSLPPLIFIYAPLSSTSSRFPSFYPFYPCNLPSLSSLYFTPPPTFVCPFQDLQLHYPLHRVSVFYFLTLEARVTEAWHLLSMAL